MKQFRALCASLLAASLVACGGGNDAPPTVSTINVSSGNNQTAVAGAKVADPIVLTLVDAGGAPVANTSASATVASGGGSLGTASYTSDSSGKITISTWTLGTTVGDQTLSVTSGAAKATVAAKATAGAAAKITPLPDNVSTGNIGASIAAPGVTVTDANNNPVANATVTFSVAANNGVLSGATATTNVSGVARVPGWTLGPLVGTQKLTAKVGTSASLDISVNATLAAGCVTQPVVIGLPVNGEWTSTDCSSTTTPVGHYDEYSLTLATPANFRAKVTGANGRKLRIFDATGRVVGEMPSDAFAPAAVNPLEIQYALPAGQFKLRVYAPDAATLGAYTLSLTDDFSNAITDAATCRPVIFATFGASVTQTLKKGNCSFMGDNEDRYILLLQTGETVKITLTSTAMSPYLLLRDDRTPTSPVVASDRRTAPGTATLTYTATFSDFHEIIVTSNTFVEEGSYTITVSKP
ncbi:Ig-like domain-containing protein [Massilia endophytica]|uniref:Ig-like domain-containing protein n=1 Tax=Massilia endophytica TaxID=2899220 RepID=UPI001E3E4B8A|nr:Ig-like domain-containing protein [Massilia endophytica]UGQ48096.1 Ig-like domain-containing protein [Massilia endophytica]